MSIVDLEAFRGYYRTGIASDDPFALSAIAAAESAIQEECQRSFAVAGTAAARTYVPRPCSGVLRIHDCTTVTSVVENSTTLTVAVDYQKEPVQTVSWSGETRPYEQLRRLSGPWYSYLGTGTVVVTATWGWLAIPPAITEATMIMAKDIYDSRDVKFGIAAVTDFGPSRVRENPKVQQLLAPYKRVESFGIA